MSIFGLNSLLESARHVSGTDAKSGRAGTPWPAGQQSWLMLLSLICASAHGLGRGGEGQMWLHSDDLDQMFLYV